MRVFRVMRISRIVQHVHSLKAIIGTLMNSFTNVLNIMNDLFLDETPPPELARSPSSSASSKLTDALANAGRRGR